MPCRSSPSRRCSSSPAPTWPCWTADGVRAVLEQVRGILQQRPHLGTLVTATRELEERVDHLTNAPPFAASSLTPAELRVIPLLPTRMTMVEMGEALFLSRNTVKTQAISVYRKLGVSSRKEAVERLVELGLLGGHSPEVS